MINEYDPKSPNFTPYYCNLCKIYCASPINLQTHFLGGKHKQFEALLKSHGVFKPLCPAKDPKKDQEGLPDDSQTKSDKNPMRTLQEELDSCQDFEPAIGLQYITEHRTSDDYPVYDCSLCGCQTGVSNMFMHILGVRHRYAYAKKHYPEKLAVTGKAAIMNKRLKALATKIETDEGRQRIKVTTEPLIPNATGAYAASVPIPPYKVDTVFAEDDVCIEANLENDTYKKKEAPSLGKKETAKKTEKENPTLGKKETAKKTEKENPTLEKKESAMETENSNEDEEANTQCDNSNKSEKQQDKNTEKQKNVVLKDYDESEGFDDNEELLKYLQCFEIMDESDAYFILKMIQKLTHALVMYRYVLEKKPYPEKRSDVPLEQINIAYKQTDGPNAGVVGVQPPIQRPCDNEGTNLMVKSAFKRKASHLNTNPPKDNTKSFKRGSFVSTFKEIPKEEVFPDDDTQDADAIMQESSSKETAPIAKMQDGASKDKALDSKMQESPSKETAPVAKMQDGASKQKALDAKMQESSSKETAPVAKMQEGASKKKAPDAKMQESHSKEKVPDTEAQQADTKMQESPSEERAPSAIPEKKDLPSSENLSNPTPDKKSSPQNQSAASSTTGSVPSTENNVIAQFFNSIRNMEVHEVAATLHKIATSNPAFHGMDVQNVIKILTMSGNLKPEDTSSAQ